jgi:hypothetical protein
METTGITKLAHEIRARGFNPADYADDVVAANWVMAALDPADSAGSNGAVLGIPDHSDQPSTVIAWRQLNELAPAVQLGLSSSDTWEFDMITMEGPYVYAAGQMRKTGAPSTYWNFWIMNSMFNFSPSAPGPGPQLVVDANANMSVRNPNLATNWQQNVSHARPVWSSCTMEFIGATLTDQGKLAVAQMPNMWTRTDFSNVTANNIAAVLSGTTFLGQSTSVAQASLGLQSRYNPYTLLQESVSVPKIDTIMMIAPGSRSWKASKGAYIPLRYQQPALLYADSTEVGAVNGFVHPWNMNAISHSASPLPGTVDDSLPPGWLPDTPLPQTCTPIVGTFTKLMRVGAVCATGLAPTTTFSLVFRSAFEILPPPAAPWSANLTPSCKPSDRAVEAYFRLRHELPDAFESSWNRLGTLKKVVGGLAQTVTGVAKKAVGGVQKAASAVSSAANSDTGRRVRSGIGRMLAPSDEAQEESEAQPQQGKRRPIVEAIKRRRAAKAQ